MTRRQTAREQVQKDKTNKDDKKKTKQPQKKKDQNRWDSTQVKPLNTRTIQHCPKIDAGKNIVKYLVMSQI